MPHLSRRSFAKTRGLSESRIRALIAEGVLSEAVLPNGLIDSEMADALLAANLTRPKSGAVAPVLRTARTRRDRAQARTNEEQLVGLRNSLITRAQVREGHRLTAILVDGLRAFASRAAPKVLGLEAREVHAMLKAEQQAVFRDINVQVEIARRDRPPRASRAAPEIDGLTPVELQALLVNQATERLTLERLAANGSLLRVDDVRDADTERGSVLRSTFVAIAGRVDQKVANAPTVEEIERIISEELERALAAYLAPMVVLEGTDP